MSEVEAGEGLILYGLAGAFDVGSTQQRRDEAKMFNRQHVSEP